MSNSAPRPCAETGCRALVRSGSRCPMHARPSTWAKRQHIMGHSAARGYGSAWRRARAQVAEEEQGCRACGSEDTRWVCDHIIPKIKGGTDDRANLQRLCKRCSDTKTAREGHEIRAKGRKIFANGGQLTPKSSTRVQARNGFVPK